MKADAIYMEATAYTDNGNVYSVDERSEKTLMIKEDRVFSETYNLTIWPAGFLVFLREKLSPELIIYSQMKTVQLILPVPMIK